MRVLITGASGWVGSAVVPELLAADHQLVGLARSDTSATALEAAGVEVLRGSLDDLDTLGAAAADADGVLHLAFKHEQMFSGDVEAAIGADRQVIDTLGEALAGTDRPLVIASGLAGHASGTLVTEDDAPEVGAGASGRMGNELSLLALADRGVRSASVRLPPTVHGDGDNGFLAMFVAAARERGASAYAEEGANHWPAVHRSDAARLFRLALESAAPGSVLHGAGEEGVAMRDIAEAIGRGLDLPTHSLTLAEAAEHFGWLAGFVAMDVRASSARTRKQLGWEITGPGLLDDLAHGHYFGSGSGGAAG